MFGHGVEPVDGVVVDGVVVEVVVVAALSS